VQEDFYECHDIYSNTAKILLLAVAFASLVTTFVWSSYRDMLPMRTSPKTCLSSAGPLTFIRPIPCWQAEPCWIIFAELHCDCENTWPAAREGNGTADTHYTETRLWRCTPINCPFEQYCSAVSICLKVNRKILGRTSMRFRKHNHISLLID